VLRDTPLEGDDELAAVLDTVTLGLRLGCTDADAEDVGD